ncbi:unnamed protein product [Linum trigynum]|uniref:Uncharacterized protein n=1 Tax=Linum trigynum TaxID=586398 RepID=A0AAV2DTP8_9ROSI
MERRFLTKGPSSQTSKQVGETVAQNATPTARESRQPSKSVETSHTEKRMRCGSQPRSESAPALPDRKQTPENLLTEE